MLTDLPLRAIDEINATLAIIGYDEAWVLVEQRDDPITRIGQSLFKMARNLLDQMISDMQLSAKIHVCLVMDKGRDFQACAIRLGEDEYCIMIWLAAAIRTSASISRILSTSVSAEFFSADFPVSKNQLTSPMGDTFEAYAALSLLPILDLGTKLNEFRNQLDSTALEWLVLHELGHIVNGHLALGKTVNGVTYILEYDLEADRNENISHQALEMDADCFANLFCLQGALTRRLSIDQIDTGDEGKRVEKRLQSYVFAVLAIIRGFDYAPFEIETLFDSDHPPGGVRMGYLLAQMLMMEKEGKIDFGGVNVKEATGKTAVSLERAISEATGIDGNGGNLLAAFAIGDSFLAPVLSRWAKVYPELNAAKISPFKLAPPQYEPA